MLAKIRDMDVSNFYGAFWYVWNHSEEIRHWYLTQSEKKFDPKETVTPYNYRVSGDGNPGDIVAEIVYEGERLGIIQLNDEIGEYEGVSAVVCPKCRSDDVVKDGSKIAKGGRVPALRCGYCGYRAQADKFSN